MSKQLRIFKVNSKPLVFQPSSLYLVKDSGSGLLYTYLSDSTGSVIYRGHEGTDISNIVNAILNMSKGQPNGLAVLDGDGLIPVINLPSNSPTADKLSVARLINLVSDVVGSASFDGSSDINISATLATITDSGTGSFKKITTNSKGLVTGTAAVAEADITGLLGAGSITNAMLANAAVTNLNGTNTGDQTIALTGDVTGSGTGTFAATLATITDSGVGAFKKVTTNSKGLVTGTAAVAQADITGLLGAGSITNTMLANGAVANLSGTNTGDETTSTIKTKLGVTTLSGSNTGDQTITLTGDVTGSGTGSFAATLANSGATAGTYKSVTINAKGLVTGGTNPTTLAGYGITDAINISLIGAPNGVAGLDATGKISNSVIVGMDGQTGDITSNGGYVWGTVIPFINVLVGGGGNSPTFGVVYGTYQGLLFSASTMNQFWCDYSIPHDIALNTKVYPSIKWLPTTNASGVVRFGIEYTLAKGFGQQAFSTSTVTVYIQQTVAANSRYLNNVAIFSDADAILSANIEPNSVIKARIFRDGGHASDTYSGTVHIWEVALHYQKARIGSINKSPPYYV